MDTYFSCSKFAAELHAQLQARGGDNDGPPRVEDVALDLVALFLLGSGNDYLSPVRHNTAAAAVAIACVRNA